MFLRWSALFTVLFVWSHSESALDSGNQTEVDAPTQRGLSHRNERPLVDGQTLEKPQDATKRVDEEKEARGLLTSFKPFWREDPSITAAREYLQSKPHPEEAFETLRIAKAQEHLAANAVLKLWIKYAQKYRRSRKESRWYKPEKAFKLLAEDHPVVDVVDWFYRLGMKEDADSIRALLSGFDFPAVRRSMNAKWLASKTTPEVVFKLLSVGKFSVLDDPDAFHWILYCDQFRKLYGDGAFPVEDIVQVVVGTKSLSHPLLYGVFIQKVKQYNVELTDLAEQMHNALYEPLLTMEKLSPIVFYHYLVLLHHRKVLGLSKADPWFCTLRAYTISYASITGDDRKAQTVFDNKEPAEILAYLTAME